MVKVTAVAMSAAVLLVFQAPAPAQVRHYPLESTEALTPHNVSAELWLRKETPPKYESYVDLVPGEWTRITS